MTGASPWITTIQGGVRTDLRSAATTANGCASRSPSTAATARRSPGWRRLAASTAATFAIDVGEHRAPLWASDPIAHADRMPVGQRLALHNARDPRFRRQNRLGAANNTNREPPIKRNGRSLSKPLSGITGASPLRFIRTRHWATAHRASSGNRWWKRRPRTRPALGVDRMKAQCPRMRSGQGHRPRGAETRSGWLDASAAGDHPKRGY
jgi:hypothetical protein